MSDPTSNVKIYDRPEPKIPRAVMIVLVVLAVAVCGFFIYRAMHPAVPTTPTPQGLLWMVSTIAPVFDVCR